MAVEESDDIRGSLLRIGKHSDALDFLMAGTAVANGAEKLVSGNRDFGTMAAVTDLNVEIIM